PPTVSHFSLHSSCDIRHLLSFPTRRSSDLLDISAEEAKSKEFGLLIGYGTFEGAIAGVQWRDRDLFGYGRPLTTSVEVSQRSYRSEEHTSELQSRGHLVCRLLLEKKK